MSVLLDRSSPLSGPWAEEVVECSGEGVGRGPPQVIRDDDDVLAPPEPDAPHPLHRPAVGTDLGVVDLDDDPRLAGPWPAELGAVESGRPGPVSTPRAARMRACRGERRVTKWMVISAGGEGDGADAG